MKKLKLRISPFFILMLSALVFTHSYLSLAALLAAFLHELGHMLAARLCSLPLREMRLDIFGASLTPEASLCSYGKELTLALGGPTVNIISFIVLWSLWSILSTPLRLFAIASLFLGLLNLLPIADTDGGRILKCMLMQVLAPHTAHTICRAVSFFLLFCLWTLSLYLLLRLSASLSLFIFSLALFAKTFLIEKA